MTIYGSQLVLGKSPASNQLAFKSQYLDTPLASRPLHHRKPESHFCDDYSHSQKHLSRKSTRVGNTEDPSMEVKDVRWSR